MATRQELLDQLSVIEKEIDELEERIPPHSVQPHLIARLDELEAVRDRIKQDLDEANE